jgi:hypothetical protein
MHSADASGRVSPSGKRKRGSDPAVDSVPQRIEARRSSTQINGVVPERPGPSPVTTHFNGNMLPAMHLGPRSHSPAFYASPYPPPDQMSNPYDDRLWAQGDPFVGSLPSPAVNGVAPAEVTQAFTQAAFSSAPAFSAKLQLPSNRARQTSQPMFAGQPPPHAVSVEQVLQQDLGAQASPLLLQAVQLIGYHLSNRRANPTYPLPPALLPTQLQASVPHGVPRVRAL